MQTSKIHSVMPGNFWRGFSFKALLVVVFMLSSLGLKAQSWPGGVHDPSSIIKCKDKYWIFATGDGIAAKYSSDLVTWTDAKSPFTLPDFPAWIKNYAKTATDTFAGFFWAPDVIYMNNKYYLYYSCSVWGTMSSCIGVVTNATLDPADPAYLWEDQGDIGIWSSGGTVNAIDPAVMRGPDNKIWLTYGSFNRDGIMVTEVDSITGKPKGTKTSIANSWTGGTAYGEGEGGCMIYHNGYYYLFYNKGGCCSGIASSYYMVMGRSSSPTGPFRDKAGKYMRVVGAASGGTVFFRHDDTRGLNDRYYGPGHLGWFKENGIEYASFHYYSPNGYYPNAAANYMGGPTLGMGMLKWGADGWPTLSFDFLDKGYYNIKNANSNLMMDTQSRSTATGAPLIQKTTNSLWDTQRWLFTPLGTGEYTIRSYADTTKYLEATGTNHAVLLKLTDNYTDSVYQKFRVVMSPNGKILLYPSRQDNVFQIANDTKLSGASVTLYSNTNKEGQRWYANPFIETLSVSQSSASFNYTDTVCTAVAVTSNGTWAVTDMDSWVTVAPASNSGDATLTITAAQSLSASPRSCTLSIKSKGGQLQTVVLNQAANPSATPVKNTSAIKVDAYPNPTRNKVNINTELPATLIIYNSVGQQIATTTLTESPQQVDISGLKAGMYFLQITGNSGSSVVKIEKQN